MLSWRSANRTGTSSPNYPRMRKAGIWIGAFRPRTLPLALSSTILGSFLAFAEENFKWGVFLFVSLTTLFLQVLSNLANDYGDGMKGSDGEKRLGPQRLTQAGLVSREQMRTMIGIFVALSLVSGSLLIWSGLRGSDSLGYVVFFLLGVSAILAAIKYTVGRRPYGYRGLGDVMVFVYFGILGVAGTYFLHTGGLHAAILLPASSVGPFSMGVLNLNNMRDRENEAENGKITLVVRKGIAWAKVYHVILLGLAFVLAVAYTLLKFESYWQLIFLLPVPLLISDIQKVITNTVPVELNPELRKLAMATLLFSLAFGLGLLL